MFSNPEQEDFAKRQLQTFQRCPYLYMVSEISTGTAYIGSRWGKRASPFDEYYGSSYSGYEWDNTAVRYVVKVYAGDTPPEKVLYDEQELLKSIDAAKSIYFLNKTNVTDGSDSRLRASRDALQSLYPETNGMAPQCIEAGIKRTQELFPKGISPKMRKNGCRSRAIPVEVKFPDSDQWIYCYDLRAADKLMGYKSHSGLVKRWLDLYGSPMTISSGKFKGFSLRWPEPGCRSETDFLEIADKAYEVAFANGHWSEDTNLGEVVCMIHSELSELLAAIHDGSYDKHLPEYKSAVVEAADVVIFIMSMMGHLGKTKELCQAIIEKIEINRQRGLAHGEPDRRKNLGATKL